MHASTLACPPDGVAATATNRANRIAFLLFLGIFVVVNAVVAASEPAVAYRGPEPSVFDAAITRGTLRDEVRRLAGQPDAYLGPDVWVYYRCKSSDGARSADGLDTVVVVFSRNVVARMKMVSRRSVEKRLDAAERAKNAGAW